jgi:hypothetical protein
VSGTHAPLLAIAGVALLVIAGVNLWRDLQSAQRPADSTPSGLQLDGLFGSDRERAARPAAALEADLTDVLGGPGSADGPSVGPDDSTRTARDSSDVDYRSRALAAGRAAAAHEGLDAPPERVADRSELVAMAAPTAVFETIVPTGPPAMVVPTAALSVVAAGRTRTVGGGPAGGTPFDRSATWGGWALLAVALAVLLLAPPALGPYQAARAGTVAAALVPPGDPPPGDPASMSLVDYASHAATGGLALAGRQVRLVGFVMAGPRSEPYLARLVIGCCAAVPAR